MYWHNEVVFNRRRASDAGGCERTVPDSVRADVSDAEGTDGIPEGLRASGADGALFGKVKTRFGKAERNKKSYYIKKKETHEIRRF